MYKNKKVFAIIDCTDYFLIKTNKKNEKKENKRIEELKKDITLLDYGEDYFTKPIFINTLDVFEESDIVDEIYLIVDEENLDKIKDLIKEYNIKKVNEYILSDNLRQYSMEGALASIISSKKEPQFLITHDAAVPFINKETIKELADNMHKNMACVYGSPLKDSVKKLNIETMKIEERIGVHELWQTNFPKMFLSGILTSAYDYAREFNLYSEEDSTLIGYMRFPIKMIEGDTRNIKLNFSIFDNFDRIFKNI